MSQLHTAASLHHVWVFRHAMRCSVLRSSSLIIQHRFKAAWPLQKKRKLAGVQQNPRAQPANPAAAKRGPKTQQPAAKGRQGGKKRSKR